jgi:putative addiction module CopG family antidote
VATNGGALTRPFPDLSHWPSLAGMDGITLPPELEQFAAEAVAAGRYRDLSEVIRAGIALLRQAEAEMAAFVASLEEARAEGAQDGFLTAEEVHHEIKTMLDEMARTNV